MSSLQYYRRLAALALGTTLMTGAAFAQISISTNSGSPNAENFDGIGTSIAATVPTNWRIGKNSGPQVLGTYAAAGTATEQYAGNNMSTSAPQGIYNYGAGVFNTATDRALGFISSSSGTNSGNIYAWFRNTSGSTIDSLTISYEVEKYRNGTNAAGYQIQLHYSTDGSTWTSAGAPFLTTFAADASNSGFANAPGVTVNVSNTLTVSIPNNGDLYLAWNYSVQSGTTYNSGQGLGVDNFSMYGTPTPEPPLSIHDWSIHN